ncbi:hypothetical protein [Chelativorans salis]|uniref:Uncharacterized protein n=1 Tax=Chelativorans salis TaxID=2978478 RepID=A0ABT2LUH2_9HYPH|nr:hypothetical protein [Chelativorans sp. EGI FJ00035]MCT7378173.1 hypothetical protein [Chelativorans sp. EGI FJ00035]
MKKLLSAVGATILAASFALPANAAPLFVPKPAQVQGNAVEKVHGRDWRRKHYPRGWARSHWKKRYARQHCDYYGYCYPHRYYSYRDHYPHYYRPRSGVSIYFSF